MKILKEERLNSTAKVTQLVRSGGSLRSWGGHPACIDGTAEVTVGALKRVALAQLAMTKGGFPKRQYISSILGVPKAEDGMVF